MRRYTTWIVFTVAMAWVMCCDHAVCVHQSNVSLRSRIAEQLLNDLAPPDHHEVLLKLAIEGRKTPQAEQNGLCSSS